MKKYELTDAIKTLENGVVLHQIMALRSIPGTFTSIGGLGGWVESESNLSQDGDAWVTERACVYGAARVRHDAMITDDAEVSGDTQVCERARISDFAKVSGIHILIRGNARIEDHVVINGLHVSCGGHAILADHVVVLGELTMDDNTRLRKNVKVTSTGKLTMLNQTRLSGTTEITGDLTIS
jgi:predicted acyltransferase (DUF342 family)